MDWAGATYYSTNSWKDMLDTYRSVTQHLLPIIQSSLTLLAMFKVNPLLVDTAIQILEIPIMGFPLQMVSLSINGNGHTLYLDSDTNYLQLLVQEVVLVQLYPWTFSLSPMQSK